MDATPLVQNKRQPPLTSPFLLLTTIQLSRAKKDTEYLPFKRAEGSFESTVIGPNIHQK
jgi:hypothetical protein